MPNCCQCETLTDAEQSLVREVLRQARLQKMHGVIEVRMTRTEFEVYKIGRERTSGTAWHESLQRPAAT